MSFLIKTHLKTKSITSTGLFFLFFLLIRPTLDLWRDLNLFYIQEAAINLNGALAIIFLLWGSWALLPYLKKLKRVPLLGWLITFIGLTFLSSFLGVSFFTSVIETIKFANLALMFTLAFLFVKNKKIYPQQLLLTIILSAIIPLSIGLAQVFLGSGMTTFGLHGRIHGSFAHPNVFAFFTLFLLFLHIHFSTIEPANFWKKHRQLKIFTYLALFAFILMTYTRAALIGLAIFLIVIGILKYRKMLLMLVATIVIFLTIFYPLNQWLIKTNNYSLQEITLINRLTSRNEDADSIAWRKALVRESIPIIYSRPMLGYGYGTFPLVWETYRGTWHQWDDSAEAHNDYLRLVLEIGTLGLALYLALLFSLLYYVFRLYQKKEKQFLYLLAWIVVFMAVSLSDNMLHHTPVMWLMWAWWGASLALPASVIASRTK